MAVVAGQTDIPEKIKTTVSKKGSPKCFPSKYNAKEKGVGGNRRALLKIARGAFFVNNKSPFYFIFHIRSDARNTPH